MIEIKFDKKKKKKDNPIKKMTNSQKLAWFSGACFATAIMFSMLIFTYGVFTGSMCDFTMLNILISVTGAVFGVTMVAYASKSRFENVIKIQMSYLKEIGVLDVHRAISEIEKEFDEMEDNADNEKNLANQEITYNG